ncbi:DUF4259 domain-containing protein [Paenibacillus methanolicus]|uniref:Uncharacterized protein DUF4259 n=1 Tax=Paenibacillus methanolicus TaxID=582686 RepID=A0A5S5C777_9BACL|nr:DUF4259 domain-containing protein [Paenibacillus methanolicus]TYP74458.1 uncharacterized protein DUF4259 [Paenibacillus methanolicus]
MGYWGYGVFQNDFVGDWVIDLIESDSMNLIEEAIQLPLKDAFIEADTASIAIGAIEILLALQVTTNRKQNLKEIHSWEYEELEEWIENHKGQGGNLLVDAHRALVKIIAESELAELWKDSDQHNNWLKTVKDLENRLSQTSREITG